MESRVVKVGDVAFAVDADLHHQKAMEVGERVVGDSIIHPDGRKGSFIDDKDLAYLLAASTVLLHILSTATDEAPEVDTEGIPDLPGHEDGPASIH